jgi:hypothetical protein
MFVACPLLSSIWIPPSLENTLRQYQPLLKMIRPGPDCLPNGNFDSTNSVQPATAGNS